MRRALHAILRSALVAGATTGGSPCGDPCADVPARSFVNALRPRDPDGGYLDMAPSDAATEDAADGGPSDAGDAYAPYFLPDSAVDCREACGRYLSGPLTCRAGLVLDAAPAVECTEGPHRECSGSGRAHADVAGTAGSVGGAVGRWLAETAVGEAGSVLAFRRMRAEYKFHGAPRRLLRQISRAGRDEVRHARALGALARRDGASFSPPRLCAGVVRSLEALAIENAVEGCVFETYGAVVAAWRGRHARDGHVRAALARVARDEARHAELAWSLAHFAEPRLTAAGRRRVDAARRRAFERLRREVSCPTPALVARGLTPTAAVGGAMVAALEAALLR